MFAEFTAEQIATLLAGTGYRVHVVGKTGVTDYVEGFEVVEPPPE